MQKQDSNKTSGQSNILDTSEITFLPENKGIFKTDINGLFVVSRAFFADSRGGFQEHFRIQDIWDLLGEPARPILQSQGSWSQAGVLRGMHAGPEDKFIFPLMGVFDVAAVDVRKNSETFGKSLVLKFDNSSPWSKQAIGYFIRRGIANGFHLQSASGPNGLAYYEYMVTATYSDLTSTGFRYDDPELKIPWPEGIKNSIVSDKDLAQPSWKDFLSSVDQKMYE